LAQDLTSNPISQVDDIFNDPLDEIIIKLLGATACINDETMQCQETITCAITELSTIYKQRYPYTTLPTIVGGCVKFEDAFIYLVRYAMATDCLLYMSTDEKDMWNAFVQFENTGQSVDIFAANALDDLLVNLVLCNDTNNKNTDCSFSCEPGYLTPVPNDPCDEEITPTS
jgi:hypothetical protein